MQTSNTLRSEYRQQNLTPKSATLLQRRIVNPAEAIGQQGDFLRAELHRKQARRELFRLTGQYFSEEKAADILREADVHAWIEAEKAGRDIWAERDPEEPRRAALHDWFRRFFPAWNAQRWLTSTEPLMTI